MIKLSSLNKGLVGHWPLDIESLQSATTFADKTPNENVGTKYGSVLKFDPTDATYVNIPSISLTNISVSAWIKVNTTGVYKTYINIGNLLLNVMPNNKIHSNLQGAGGVTSNTAISNDWTNVVVIINGSNTLIYLDGVLDATLANTSFTSGAGHLGCYLAGSQLFNGSIGDTRIYSRALSSAEVLTMYQGGVVSDTDLEAHYKMKDKENTTLTDETGVNGGTLIGFTDTTAEYGNTHNSGWVTNDTPNVFALDYMGQSDRAMSFNGKSDYIALKNQASLQFGTGDFSVSAWIKLSDVLTSNFIYDQRDSASDGFRLVGYVNNIEFNVNTVQLMADTEVISDTWYHIVGVRNGNVGKIYIDNVQDNNTSDLTGQSISTAIIPKIGARAFSTPLNFFHGSMADVRIYNRALSQAEITQLYETYRPKLIVS